MCMLAYLTKSLIDEKNLDNLVIKTSESHIGIKASRGKLIDSLITGFSFKHFVGFQ